MSFKIYLLVVFVSVLICNIIAGTPRAKFCVLPIAPGTCTDSSAFEDVFGYNAAKQRCEKFTYTGCGGNQNRFAYKGMCENKAAEFCY